MKKKLKEWIVILAALFTRKAAVPMFFSAVLLFFVFLNGCDGDGGLFGKHNMPPVSPISLFSGAGPYPASCPLIFTAPSKTLLRVYNPTGKYLGIACSIPLSIAYCSVSLGSPLDDGTYSVRASIDNVEYSTNFEFKKSSECPNCYVSGKPYKDKDKNPQDESQFCDAKNNPYGWTTTACVHYSPGVVVIPTYQTGSPSQSMSFNVYIKNNDLSACVNSTFTVTPGAPAGWTTSGSQTVEIPPSVTASTEVTFTPPSTASGEIELAITASANGLSGTSYTKAQIIP